MITRIDLLSEIQKCQREPVTVSSIERLACLYIVYDHLYADDKTADTSMNEREKKIQKEGESEFLKRIEGVEPEKVWRVMDELMSVIRVTTPRLYEKVMEKFEQ